jgi:hypothetical protein
LTGFRRVAGRPGWRFPNALRCENEARKSPGFIAAFRAEQGVGISALYLRDNIAIADNRSSLKRDVCLLRESKGTPKRVNIYGYLFNIDDEALTLVVEDHMT